MAACRYRGYRDYLLPCSKTKGTCSYSDRRMEQTLCCTDQMLVPGVSELYEQPWGSLSVSRHSSPPSAGGTLTRTRTGVDCFVFVAIERLAGWYIGDAFTACGRQLPPPLFQAPSL